MKLATLNTTEGPRVIAVANTNDGDRYLDLSSEHNVAFRSVKQLLLTDGALEPARETADVALREGRFVEGTLLAPIPSPGKVLCIGLNYRDHAEETGAKIPTEPVCFSKFSSTVIGPGAAIRLPAVATQVDYEAELVAVIGRQAYGIKQEEAFDYVAGYMNGHDVSARDWQKGRPGGQWLLGKTPDTFAPTGPYLVTADEIDDPHALSVQLRLNGETMQDGNTSEFIFGIDEIIAHVTQLITLEPGDLIFTGTPPGVGMARDPQVFLKPGDTVEVEVAGLGTLRNPVEAAN